jgi:hypothetical protein
MSLDQDSQISVPLVEHQDVQTGIGQLLVIQILVVAWDQYPTVEILEWVIIPVYLDPMG